MGRKPIYQVAMTAAERQKRYRNNKSKASGVVFIAFQSPRKGFSQLKSIDAADVQECFKKAAIGTTRLKLPPVEYCQRVARVISGETLILGAPIGVPRLIAPTQKYARLFLKHAALSQARMEFIAQGFQTQGIPGISNSDLVNGLPTIKLATKSVQSLLDLYGNQRSREFNWGDLAETILYCGMRGWMDRYNPEDNEPLWMPPDSTWKLGFPKSINEHDPLCLFVWHVLQHLGNRRSVSTVSAVLRQRRKRTKPGQSSIEAAPKT